MTALKLLAALTMAFTARFSIDPVGTVDPRTGDAQITGKMRCSEPAHAIVEIELTQEAHGRFLTVVDFVEFECGPEAKTWRVVLRTGPRGFREGPAFVEGFGEASTPDVAVGMTVNQEVMLERRP